jgi:hypothetical protein
MPIFNITHNFEFIKQENTDRMSSTSPIVLVLVLVVVLVLGLFAA